MRRLPALLATVLAAVLATLLSAPAAQAASWPVVGSGSTGANVTTIQHLLTARNHATAADGIFGSGTADKVKSFQRSQSLTADGVVGPGTWSKLIVTVSSGSNGSAVKAAQVQLNRYGHGLAVDGAFGSGTASAAKKFQQSKGLSADGIVGPDTWRALVSGSGSGGGGGGGSTKLTHAQVSSMFSGAGITWTSTGNCSNRNVSTCTSFEQMRRTTAEGTVALKRASGCAILVTGVRRRATPAARTATGTATKSTSARSPASATTSPAPSPASATEVTAPPGTSPPRATSTRARAATGTSRSTNEPATRLTECPSAESAEETSAAPGGRCGQRPPGPSPSRADQPRSLSSVTDSRRGFPPPTPVQKFSPSRRSAHAFTAAG